MLWKSPEEKKEIENKMRKYISFDKQDTIANKASTMFGETEVQVLDLDNSFESGDSTASQSDSVDEECQGLFFSEEEIKIMSDADKLTYMNKL